MLRNSKDANQKDGVLIMPIFFNPTFVIMPAQNGTCSIIRRGVIRFSSENNFEILSCEK